MVPILNLGTPLCRFAYFGFSPAKVPGVLSYNHTPITHTTMIWVYRISFCLGYRPTLLLPDFTLLLKKNHAHPQMRICESWKGRDCRAWKCEQTAMRGEWNLKRLEVGMIVIQGIGNDWFCKTTTPKKWMRGLVGVMNRNEFLSGWVVVVCFLSLSAVLGSIWELSTKR